MKILIKKSNRTAELPDAINNGIVWTRDLLSNNDVPYNDMFVLETEEDFQYWCDVIDLTNKCNQMKAKIMHNMYWEERDEFLNDLYEVIEQYDDLRERCMAESEFLKKYED